MVNNPEIKNSSGMGLGCPIALTGGIVIVFELTSLVNKHIETLPTGLIIIGLIAIGGGTWKHFKGY